MLQLLNFCLYLYDNYGRSCFGTGGHSSYRHKGDKKKKKKATRGWEQVLKSFLKRQKSKSSNTDKDSDHIPEYTSRVLDGRHDDGVFTEEDLERLSFSSDLATPRRQRPLSVEEFEVILSQFPSDEWELSKWTILEE